MLITPKPSAGGGFSKIHPGRYKARVEKCEDIPVKSDPSKKQLKWTFKLCEDQPFANRLISYFTTYEGGKTFLLDGLLQAINASHKNGSTFDTDNCMGKIIEVELGYPIDKRTGQPGIYPSVEKCFPYVSDVADFGDFK